ncbi:MAG TPA: cysteine desulfurase family protein [Dehalococcoidia bacterium]|nr:cysteine desulfurase family protein [Dehalococcoidia bacterium]
MEHPRIYLDHAATTAPDPRVVEAMMAAYTSTWGNPSSLYEEGQRAHAALDAARRTCAAILGCRPNEIVFTSGGSESDNLALRGAAYGALSRGRHIISTVMEHHAVLHPLERLESEGFRVTYLPVDREGLVDPADLERAVTDETTLVSIMHANNEIGSVQPVAELSRVAKKRRPGVIFHTDAVQSAGYLDLNVEALGVDLLSISAHKLYGPKGSGLLYVRNRTPFVPQILGGSQERNRRAGTENVPGIVGLVEALRLAAEEREARTTKARRLRDRLLAEVPQRIPNTAITGPLDGDRRLPNNASFCFGYVEGESILLQLDLNAISASSGSACTTGAVEPSHVLVGTGVPEPLCRSSLRLTVGKDTTDEDIDRVLDVLPRIVADLRAMSSGPVQDGAAIAEWVERRAALPTS